VGLIWSPLHQRRKQRQAAARRAGCTEKLHVSLRWEQFFEEFADQVVEELAESVDDNEEDSVTIVD
jgi:hypothetical protein